MPVIHGTCLEIFGVGVLLLGAPGAGKSDLALRLIEPAGTMRALLVADDQVMLDEVGGALRARAPETIAGRLEVRGVGIVTVPYAREAEVRLAVRLTGATTIERMPDFNRQVVSLCGVSIPEMQLDPFEASAAAKVRAMVQSLDGVGNAGSIDK